MHARSDFMCLIWFVGSASFLVGCGKKVCIINGMAITLQTFKFEAVYAIKHTVNSFVMLSPSFAQEIRIKHIAIFKKKTKFMANAFFSIRFMFQSSKHTFKLNQIFFLQVLFSVPTWPETGFLLMGLTIK